MAALKYGQSNHLTSDVGDLPGAETVCRQSLELRESGRPAGSLMVALERAWIVGAAGDLPGQAREVQVRIPMIPNTRSGVFGHRGVKRR